MNKFNLLPGKLYKTKFAFVDPETKIIKLCFNEINEKCPLTIIDPIVYIDEVGNFHIIGKDNRTVTNEFVFSIYIIKIYNGSDVTEIPLDDKNKKELLKN